MDSDEKQCPYCAEMIRQEAVKCRFCGEFLDDYNTNELSALQFRYYTRGISTALSTVCPGLGQMFQGRLAAGFCFFLAEMLAWLIPTFVVINNANNRRSDDQWGFIFGMAVIGVIHFMNILDAYTSAPGPNWDKDFRNGDDSE